MDHITQIVHDAWTQVLGTTEVDLDDRFFDVGGDSVRALAVHALITDALPDRAFSIVDLFRYPTIAGLADHLGGDE